MPWRWPFSSPPPLKSVTALISRTFRPVSSGGSECWRTQTASVNDTALCWEHCRSSSLISYMDTREQLESASCSCCGTSVIANSRISGEWFGGPWPLPPLCTQPPLGALGIQLPPSTLVMLKHDVSSWFYIITMLVRCSESDLFSLFGFTVHRL